MISKWIILFFLGSISIGQDIIGNCLYDEVLIDFLRENYKTSTTLGYTEAREVLYESIDNQDDYVYGVYSNYSVYLPPGTSAPITHLYNNGINCEHVWPQSLYEGGEPIKSDMHALRPCKDNVNSARSNKPFNEIIDSQTATWYWLDDSQSNTPTSNIDEYSESHEVYFEPREDRKGDIARTIFYFYTMYSEDADEDFFISQKDVLQTWHTEDPVDEEEITRTWQISGYQQNKPNPFILDETLIERAYFVDGFILGDMNMDGDLNILDIVILANCVLSQNCEDFASGCAADLNGDNSWNVLDIVTLTNCVLSQNCID